jgi:chitin disaccharide deacetylase
VTTQGRPRRCLVVNADDFGQSPGVNRGVIAAHERGIVTSASLMVRWPAAVEAAEYARAHPGLGVGLHIDLAEWAHRDGRWTSLYEVVPVGDAAAVAAEVARQVTAFRELVGRDPTHFDSHQHIHRDPPLCEVALDWGRRLGVPVRHFTPGVTYCGNFYGQSGKGEPCPDAIGPEALVGVLRGLPPGVTELACHPALGGDVDSMYRAERVLEVQTLTDPRVRAVVREEGIELLSFGGCPMSPGLN